VDIILIVLRLTHILAGIFWTGAAVLMTAFLLPTVRAMGAEGGKFIQYLLGKQRLSMYISLAAILCTLAGLALYWRVSGGLQLARMLTLSGLALTIGSAAGVLAAILGSVVTAPIATRMEALSKEIQSAGGPPKPEQMTELQRLQVRLGQAGLWGTILLVITAVGMAIA